MPPDVTQTFTYTDFITYGNPTYEAGGGTLSPQIFRVGINYTIDGYPYCQTYDGTPSNTSLLTFIQLQNASHCQSPFLWQIQTFPSALNTITIPGCTAYTSSATIYANGNYPTTWHSFLTGTFSISFYYGQIGIVGDHGNVIVLAIGDVTTQTDIFSFYVWNGIPGYQRFEANTSQIFNTYPSITTSDLRDGIPHFIVWTLSYSSGTLLTSVDLSIDGQDTGVTYFAPMASPNLAGSDYTVLNPSIPAADIYSSVQYLSTVAQIDTLVIYPIILTPTIISQFAICMNAWRTIARCIYPGGS